MVNLNLNRTIKVSILTHGDTILDYGNGKSILGNTILSHRNEKSSKKK